MKYSIDEIFDKMTPEEVAQLLDGIDLSESEKEAKMNKRRKFRPTRLLAAAVIVALCLATVVGGVFAFPEETREFVASIPILRNLFASEDELINPYAEPIQAEATTENSVFRLEKAVRSGDKIYIYYMIENENPFGDVYSYGTMKLIRADDEVINFENGHVMAGVVLCGTDELGGIIEVSNPDGYHGEMVLEITNFHSVDTTKLDSEGVNILKNLDEYVEPEDESKKAIEIIEKKIEIPFTLPELDNLEFTTLVENQQMEIEGLDVEYDIRVSPLQVVVEFRVPNYNGLIPLNEYFSGMRVTDNGEYYIPDDNEALKRMKEESRTSWRVIDIQFSDADGNDWSASGAYGDGSHKWVGKGETAVSEYIVNFKKPIDADVIENIELRHLEIWFSDGTILKPEDFGEIYRLYEKE